MRINEQSAVVTGASGGIGKAIAKALIDSGIANVGILVKNPKMVETALAGIAPPDYTGRIIPLVADLREKDQLTSAFKTFMDQAGHLSILVNNAGVLLDGAMAAISFRGMVRYPLEKWQQTIETNLTGTFLCSQMAAEYMMKQRTPGIILNISSISRKGRAGQVAYSASKGGVASMTYTLAQELRPFGIRAVGIAPGIVDTAMAQRIPETHRKEMIQRVSAGRMGTPEEIAHGAIFCIENDYFNGRILELDGGAF